MCRQATLFAAVHMQTGMIEIDRIPAERHRFGRAEAMADRRSGSSSASDGRGGCRQRPRSASRPPSPVSHSRLRTSSFGRRFGGWPRATEPKTVAGETSARCDFAIVLRAFLHGTEPYLAALGSVAKPAGHACQSMREMHAGNRRNNQ